MNVKRSFWHSQIAPARRETVAVSTASKVPATPRKPFGVWFSIALVLLIAGGALGWIAGKRIEVLSYLHERQRLSALSEADQAHTDLIVAALSKVTQMRLLAGPLAKPDLQARTRREQIDNLNLLRQRADLAEIKPILDFNLARAEVLFAEKAGDPQQAAQSIESARAIIQALGWEDSSDDALHDIAKREANFGNLGIARKAQE